MRLLILLFLIGSSCSKPVHDALDFEGDENLADTETAHFSVAYSILSAEGAEPKTELVKKYEEAIEAVFKKIEDAIANKKIIERSVLNEFIALRQEIEKKKDQLGKWGYFLLRERINYHIGRLTKKLVDRLTKKLEQKRSADENETRKKLRDSLDTVLEKIKQTLEDGKSVKKELLEKFKELRQKFKELKIDLSERAKELLEKIKDHAKDFLKKLLQRLGIKTNIQNDTELDEYLKQNPQLLNAVEKLEDWLISHIPDVNKNVAAEAKEFLQSYEKGCNSA